MCLLYCACYTTCILPYPLHMSHACHRFWNCYKTFTFCSLLTRCPIFCACHVKRHLNVQKCSAPLSVICTYDLEICFAPQRRALFRHVNFQKCSETMSFNTFDFEMCFAPQWRARLWALTLLTLKMCFAPQWRALVRHHNFQKCSGAEVFCTFWLGNVLRATTACNFSSLIRPDGSAPAALPSLLFDLPEPQIIVKTQWIATFLTLRAAASSFFWLFLFSDLHSSSLLSSDSSTSAFPSVHIVGSLTSKLPSANTVGSSSNSSSSRRRSSSSSSSGIAIAVAVAHSSST